VTKWHGFRQIGNSVPPLLARAVASKVREAFSAPKKPSRPVAQGDAGLLSFDMSDAAEHYGVPHDTVPQRIRKGQGAEANA
jgi:DNA (cytosine-5)-methyltransferase 1